MMQLLNALKSGWRGRAAVFLALFALAAAACGGPEEDASGGENATPADDGEETVAGGDGTDGPSFDLSGVEFTATTSPPGALNMGTFWVYDKLEEWGATVDRVILSTTTGVQALIANQSDMASHGSDELVLGAAQGAEVVGIGSPYPKMDYVLVANAEFESVEDLQGKTIAMSGPAGFDALLSRYALQEAGLDPSKDVRFVQVGGSPDRASALLTGNVDAATIFLEDWFLLSEKTDDLELLQYMAELVPEFPASAHFGMRSFWEENQELAVAVACANLEANAWLRADQDRFVDYVLEHVEDASEEATAATWDAAIEIGMWPSEPEEVLSAEGLGGLVEAMLETGDIDEPVDPETIVDNSYLQEAADMGCGDTAS